MQHFAVMSVDIARVASPFSAVPSCLERRCNLFFVCGPHGGQARTVGYLRLGRSALVSFARLPRVGLIKDWHADKIKHKALVRFSSLSLGTATSHKPKPNSRRNLQPTT